MKRPVMSAALIAAVLTAVAGCQPKPQPVAAAPAPKTWKPAPDRTVSASEAQVRVTRLQTQVGSLVGAPPATHRRELVDILDDLSKLLRSAYVGEPSPEFRSRLGVIDDARNTVSSQTVERARMESVEDQALWAARMAAAEIDRRFLLSDTQMPALLDGLDAKISAADHSRGPNHDSDATEAFESLATVLGHLADALVDNLSGGPLPTPAAMPAVPVATPTSAPSTRP